METIAEVSLARFVVHLPQRLTHPPFSAEQNIVTSKKDAVLANNAGGEGIDKDAVTEKDILSTLGTFALPRRYDQTWLSFYTFFYPSVKANMANDLPLSQKLSDKELRAQITTMMLAGFETSRQFPFLNPISWLRV